MNLKHILTVYFKELKDQLRDRRTLISMVVIPAVVMPLIMVGTGTVMSKVMKQARQETPSVMILGGADSPAVVAALKAEKTAAGEARFRFVPSGDYKQLISDKKLRAAVEIPAGFEAALKAGEATTVNIYYYEGEMRSSMGSNALNDFFRTYREKTVEHRLLDRDLPVALVKPFDVKRQNVAPPEKVGGNLFGGFIPYIIIILCFTGAMYPAMDLTAGEKERGTMETLMCSPVSRVNIVFGKFLMVLTASIATMCMLLVSMGVTAALGGSMFSPDKMETAAKTAEAKAVMGGVMPTIDPAGLLGVFAMIAPVAVFFSALLLVVSLFAKSYKEAQSYVGPMVILVILPAVFGLLPGIELTAKTALIPILNLSLVCKEMLSGVWHWHYIALIFGSTCVYAAVAIALCVRMFNREDVMFRA
ncbi:MAG: ABC transporter permease [Opitutaceae bacterium]|jgi:sodium transport system permease protein|nr:ABC transporter permease [Opitutaceae bacterium]